MRRRSPPSWRPRDDQSPLPEHPDYARADRLLRRVGEELARRWVLKEPGAWGRDAPEAPSYAGLESSQEEPT